MNYRKIWEQHYGVIPKDKNGRSLEIHHIDGNHSNNNLSNLMLVTIEEHYQIHLEQGDYWECFMIANQRLTKSKEEISDLSRKIQQERVKNGTHPFLKKNRTKEFNEKAQKNRKTNLNFSDKIKTKERAQKRINDGTHHFLTEEFKQKIIYKEHICPHCGKIGKSNAMFRYHFNRCKMFNLLNIDC